MARTGATGPSVFVAVRRTDGECPAAASRALVVFFSASAAGFRPTPQPLISLRPDRPISIFRGLARSAIGMRSVRTPAS
ncbi:hypothetical protein STAL104432_04565 [Streptomyces albus]